MAWLRAQSASETIRDYRSRAEQVRDELTAKALAALNRAVMRKPLCRIWHGNRLTA